MIRRRPSEGAAVPPSERPSSPPMKERRRKSLLVAYFFYFVGGVLGLHHWYLERVNHAVMTLTSWGGILGVGLFRDFFLMPFYVRVANDDPKYLAWLDAEMENRQKPQWRLVRFFGGVALGGFWGAWFLAAVPEEPVFGTNLSFLKYLMPVVVALGVQCVGEVHPESGPPLKKLLPWGYAIYAISGFDDRSITSIALSTAFNFYRGRKWGRHRHPRVSRAKRILLFTMCSIVALGTVSSYLYFNCSVKDAAGHELKCRDSFQQLLASPEIQNLKAAFIVLYERVKREGLANVFYSIRDSWDPLGDKRALQIMNLTADASQKDITSRFRALSKQWHPDNFPEPDKKKEAEEKFMEIQSAYETLSEVRRKRMRKNKQSDNTWEG